MGSKASPAGKQQVQQGAGEGEVPKCFLSTCPPNVAESAALAAGLHLDRRPLAPPQFHKVDWEDGQRFDAEDDPDRTEEPFDIPSFVQRDPVEQSLKTRSEELPVPHGSFARVVHGLLDERDCAELIDRFNAKGFTPALLNIGRGRQQVAPEVRNGHRVIVDCPSVSTWLFEVLRPHLPAELYGGSLVELNDRLRCLCYTPGQEFSIHMDGNYRRPQGHPRAGDSSRVTVQVYLHDVPEENGGATTFEFGEGKRLPCQPKVGSALIFTQNLMHEGSLLTKGLKYTVRTEAMYERPTSSMKPSF
jgi:predicted 2-oxoglutarate/Fe(II)-dependent dioxygenase YbiX